MARLLFLDDDILTLQLMQKIAERNGHEAVLCETTTSALDAIAANQPDLVLMDLSLKDRDGYSFLRELRAIDGLNELRVVVVSAGSTLMDKQLSLEAGANGYYQKPIGIDLLEQIISEHVS